MRVFYLFRINKYFANVYKNKPYKMYQVLEEMYYTKDFDMNITYRYFEQIAIPFNKNSINTYLKNIDSYNYYNQGNVHYITENRVVVSKLIVSNCNLKLKTIGNYSYLFNVINDYANNIFVCDFDNKDYFWLNKITSNIDNRVVI